MEDNTSAEGLNAKALMITIGVLILIPIVYVLFIKKNAPPETPPPPMQQTEAASEIDNLKQAAEKDPSEKNYVNLGIAYFRAKQYTEFLRASQKAVTINPNSSIAYNNICSAYSCLGQWDSAIIAGQMALRINPDYQQAKTNLDWAIQMKQKGK